MKTLCTLFAFILLSIEAISQQLQPGDIAIIHLNTDPVQGKQFMSFIALKDIPVNTQITFTDIYWKNAYNIGFNHSWSSEDGHFTWMSGDAIVKAGTVIKINASINSATGLVTTALANNGNCNVGDPFYWSNSEQIIAYMGAPTIFSPAKFLWGYSTTSWIYNSNHSAITSDLPAALSTSGCHIAFGGVLGYENTSFANGAAYPYEFHVFAGSKHAFIKRFSNTNAYLKSPAPIGNYSSAFEFKVTQAGLSPFIGKAIDMWDFNDSTFNNIERQNPIQASHSAIGILPSLKLRACNFPFNYSTDSIGGIIFSTSTLNKTNIVISFDVDVNLGTANCLKLESSDDGIHWQSIGGNEANISSEEDRAIAQISYYDLTTFGTIKFTTTQSQRSGIVRVQIKPASASNRALVYFRIRIAADPATINNHFNYVGYWPYQNPGGYFTAASIFIDNIRISTTDTPSTVTLNNNLGFTHSQSSKNNPLSIYPNPASKYLVISHKTAQKGAFVSVFDMQGKSLFTQPLAEGNTITRLSINKLVKGNYIARLNNGNRIQSIPFIKQ